MYTHGRKEGRKKNYTKDLSFEGRLNIFLTHKAGKDGLDKGNTVFTGMLSINMHGIFRKNVQ